MRTNKEMAIENLQSFSSDLNQLTIEIGLVLDHIDNIEKETEPGIYNSIDLEWTKAKKDTVLEGLEIAIAGVNEQFKLLKESLKSES